MCKLLYLHTEVDNNVEGTRFQHRRVQCIIEVHFTKSWLKRKQSLYQAFIEESNTILSLPNQSSKQKASIEVLLGLHKSFRQKNGLQLVARLQILSLELDLIT